MVDYEREQEVIRSILKMHEDRLSNMVIARVLTAMKIPTKQRRFKWHHEMVRQILLGNRNIGPS